MENNERVIEGDVSPETGKIEHDGSIHIKGNVLAGSFIIATRNIEIDGFVHNAKIRSLKGSVIVHKEVKGAQALIHSGNGDIDALFVHNASLQSEHGIIVHGNVMDGHLLAKHSVFIDEKGGAIEGGEVEAGQDIITHNLGNQRGIPTSVKISDFKQRELYGKLMAMEKESAEIRVEMGKLQKFIEVIKLLGKNVVKLPMEKKTELALKVKHYNELQHRLIELEQFKTNLFIPEEERDELERSIIVRGHIFTGVNVAIDKASLDIQHNYKNVIVYKRGIIIVGDFDQFMHRKKYSY